MDSGHVVLLANSTPMRRVNHETSLLTNVHRGVIICRSEAQREGAIFASWRGGPESSDLQLRDQFTGGDLAKKDPGEYLSSPTTLLTNTRLPMALVILS